MPIYLGDVPLKPFRGAYGPVNIYCGDKKIAGWVEETKSGESVEFEGTYNDTAEVLVHGNSMQDGEPSPENPVPVLSAGDCYLLSGIGGRNLVVNSHQVKSADKTYLYYSLYLNSIADLKGCYVTVSFEVRTPNVEDVGKKFSVYCRGGLSTFYFSTEEVITNDWTRYVITTFIDDEVAETYNKQIAFHFGSPNRSLGEVRNVKVEVGNKATKWTPAPEEVEENTITEGVYKTQLPPLRKIGDVADTYNPATGEYVQRIGVKVFDGTENWRSFPNYNQLYIGNTDAVFGEPFSSQVCCMSTHYKAKAFYDRQVFENNTCAVGGNDANIAIFTDMSRLEFLDFLTAQYAAGTPVTVYYQLAEPIITHLDPVTVPTYPWYTKLEQDGQVRGEIKARCKVMG